MKNLFGKINQQKNIYLNNNLFLKKQSFGFVFFNFYFVKKFKKL